MEEVKPDSPEEDILASCFVRKETSVKSEFFELYSQAFSNIPKEFQWKFPTEGIQYNENHHQEFSFKIQQQYNNYQVVVLRVQVNFFTLTLNLFNMNQCTPLPRLASIAKGNYGTVYSFGLRGNTIAIKSFSTEKLQDKISLILARVIEEYSIFKICDCLRCGPSVKQFFGFDILVFNDSIEFAMEKCEVVPISSTRYNQLLENMWVMHRFKIIHGDITDTNFMFSPVHGKVVFIDFGLSKLIAEECGFKTYTSFRGTPNFVSEAMLNLLGPGNNWDFIDLYYNDLVCLQKMYSYQKVKLKFSQTLQQATISDQTNEEKSLIATNATHLEEIILEYEFIMAMHQAYFNQLSFMASLRAEEGKLIKMHGRRVLKIVQTLLPSPFFQRLLFEELKTLSKLDEYQQCLAQLKNRYVSPVVKSSKNHFRRRLDYSVQFSLKQDRQHRKQLILKYFEGNITLKNEAEKYKYFSLIFDCLRFDINNFDLPAKKELAVGFLESLKIKPISFGDLGQVRQVMRISLSFCLSLPLNGWKKNHRFDLLTQTVLLDIPILSQLVTLSEQVSQGDYSDQEEILILLHEFILLGKVLELKYKFDDFGHYEKVINKLKQCESVAFRKAVEIYQSSSSEESKMIVNILHELHSKGTVTENPTIFSSLTFMQDKTVKSILLKYIFIKEIERAVRRSDYQRFAMLMNRIQVEFSHELKSKSLGEDMYWDGLITQQLINHRLISKMYSDFKVRINCDQIYSKLTCSLFEVLFQRGADSALFRSTLIDFLQTCFEQNRLQLFQDYLEVVLQIFQNSQILRVEHMDLIQQLADKYLRYMEKYLQRANGDSISSVEGEKSNLRIFQGYFYFFLILVGEPVQEYIVRYETLVRRAYWLHLEQVGSWSRQRKVGRLPQFFFYNMIKYKALSEGNSKQLLQNQRNIMKIKDDSIPPFVIKKMLLHQIQMYVPDKDQMITSLWGILRWGWKYHKLNHRMQAYFEENDFNSDIIAQTLHLLWSRGDKDDAFEFMNDIVKAIGLRPINSGVIMFIQNINLFVRQHGDFFQYSLLQKKIGNVNWQSRYKIICFVHSLSTVPINKKLSLIKLILANVDMISWHCKQQALNFAFEHLLRMAQDHFLKWPVRKYLSILRFMAMNILFESERYQIIKIRKLLLNLKLTKTAVGPRQFLQMKIKNLRAAKYPVPEVMSQ